MISDPYFHHNKYQKLYINYKCGDKLLNGPHFWTLCDWNEPITKKQQKLNTKYHLDEEFMDVLHQSIIIDTKSIPQFVNTCKTIFGSYYNPLIRKYMKLKHYPSIEQVRNKAKKLFTIKKIKKGYVGVLLGYIKKKVKQANKVIAQVWDPDMYADATHNTIQTLIAPIKIRMYLFIFFKIISANTLYNMHTLCIIYL